MKGKSCRLYDEELVHNIMISTGLSIVEYVKQSKSVDAIDICEFVERNAGSIIAHTIEDINHDMADDEKNQQFPEDEEPDENPF